MVLATSDTRPRAAPVYQYACPKCLAPLGEPCRRVRKVRRVPLETVLNPHAERYAVWRAWEQPDLFEERERA